MIERNWSMPALTGFFGVLLGAVLVLLLHPAEPVAPSSPGRNSGDEGKPESASTLAESLVKLTDELHATAVTTRDGHAVLEKSLSRLERLVREIADQRSKTVEPARALPSAEPGALRPDEARRRHIADIAALHPAAVVSSHLMWTTAMVLERYGAPNSVKSGDGRVVWSYFHADKMFYITFVSGEVVETEIYSKQK